MTTSLSLSPVPAEFRAVCRQFDQWRRVRQPGDRIPDRLWAAAVAVARSHGVYRAARILHLEGQALKQRVAAANSGPHASPDPAFVELLAPPSAVGNGECTVEVEGPRGGRLRVQLRGTPVPDLVALTRLVWDAEA
jgi:hypothetical protein